MLFSVQGTQAMTWHLEQCRTAVLHVSRWLKRLLPVTGYFQWRGQKLMSVTG
jgi:hypothetical protein